MKVSTFGLCVFIFVLFACCSKERNSEQTRRSADTLYTKEKAMEVYAYRPALALEVIDSALAYGNINDVWADMCRGRIYSMTRMGHQVDSLLGGEDGSRFDTARALGENLLRHDSVKAHMGMRQDVLEMLVYIARQQDDTLRLLHRSYDLADVCRRQGAETEALRTEAEIGSVECMMGDRIGGMARIDSAIAVLDKPAIDTNAYYGFNELDATVIALKRKIRELQRESREVEIIPVANRIIERLNDYELNPERYHDNSYREPIDSIQRSDYIKFYRTQAQNYLTAVYASLGKNGDMETVYSQIDKTIRDYAAREYNTRYRAQQYKDDLERQREIVKRDSLITILSLIVTFVLIVLIVVIIRKNVLVNKKNRALVRQIDETIALKQIHENVEGIKESDVAVAEKEDELLDSDLNNMSADELFNFLSCYICKKKLFLDPNFQRSVLADKFGISNSRIGVAFAHGSSYNNLTDYVRKLRINYACNLLHNKSEMPLGEIASASGFSSQSVFNRTFKQAFSITPQEYRNLNSNVRRSGE